MHANAQVQQQLQQQLHEARNQQELLKAQTASLQRSAQPTEPQMADPSHPVNRCCPAHHLCALHCLHSAEQQASFALQVQC